MQELVLIQPARTQETMAREATRARLHREFETLLAECGPLAYRIAHGVLRNAADAEDVAQEALLRAYQKFERLENKGSFRGWLARITFRLALDRWRSVKRRRLRETVWALPDRQPLVLSTEEVATFKAFEVRLQKALDDLPEKLRLVLLLAAIEGYTLEEVAGILGIPIGTVKSRLFFGRKALVEKLR